MAISKDFREILLAFFSEHDKRHKRKVDKLVKMFEGKEDEVLLELCRKYNVSPNSIDGFEVSDDVAAKYEPTELPDPELPANDDHTSGDSHESADEHDDVSEEAEVPAKKGGKVKVLLAVFIILILAAGAVAHFMGLLGGGAEEATQDQAVEVESNAEQETGESLMGDSTATESISDSLGTDSLSVDSNATDIDSSAVNADTVDTEVSEE